MKDTIPSAKDIVPGATFRDVSSGPCTVIGKVRRSHASGSDWVDVKSVLWNGTEITWTAVITNLRFI